MPRPPRIPADQLEKEAEFDRAFPGWQEVITAQAPPYDDAVHQAFKHRFRAEVRELRSVVDHCQQCKSETRMLVADPTQHYTALRGLVCRPCRAKLVKIDAAYWTKMAGFWLEYCQVHCHRSKRDLQGRWCEHHIEEARWWSLAAARDSAVALSA